MRSILPFLAASLTTAVPPVFAAQPIAVPAFSAVQLNGGGDVVVRKGSVQRVTIVSGSTDFTRVEVDRRSLKIRACARQCPSDYRLRVVVETPWLPAVAVHGGGTIQVDGAYGPQRTVAAAVHGGGTIDFRSTPVGNVAAAVTGGGNIVVGAARSLAVAITGGGDIRYAGNPAVTTAIRGGGTVGRL